MVVVLVLGGIQMMMLGVLGEYLWRTFEAARQRPIYFLEETSEVDSISEQTAGQRQSHEVERRFGT